MSEERNPNGDLYGCECEECKRYYAEVRDYEEALMNRLKRRVEREG